MVKIIIESHIPFADGLLDRVAIIERLPPSDITAETVRDADALIIRTRTRCNAALLSGSRVKAIATATIGTDHIDLDYCRAAGIAVSNAPGCNAPAVAQYVMSTILSNVDDVRHRTIGIVGVGNVGKIVAAWAEAAGMNTMLCDPPRAEAEGPDRFVGLDEIVRHADIITFHTPLDASTFHMADEVFFHNLAMHPFIINAARGPIVDTKALNRALDSKIVSGAAIDCWENEPDIDRNLLGKAIVATPHIAGYSLEGKKRATALAINAIIDALRLPVDKVHVLPVPATPAPEQITASYDPLSDTARLKNSPELFESLRNNYHYRPEP